MALVCGGRTYVQKVSVTKKVSTNINRRKVSNDGWQNMKSVYHSKQNYRISLDNSRLLWDFGSFLVRLLILFGNFLDRRIFQGCWAEGDHRDGRSPISKKKQARFSTVMIDTNTFLKNSMSDLWNGRLIQPRSYFLSTARGSDSIRTQLYYIVWIWFATLLKIMNF